MSDHASGADITRRFQTKTRFPRNARSLADDTDMLLGNYTGTPTTWDPDYEACTWLDCIDQTRLYDFNGYFAQDDMEIDDGV